MFCQFGKKCVTLRIGLKICITKHIGLITKNNLYEQVNIKKDVLCTHSFYECVVVCSCTSN
jgi:hypothetical protein